MKFLIFFYILNSNNMDLKTATFGSGCFWCTEAIFELVEGVSDVVSGYAAGDTKNPTYKEVTSGTTNHAEVVSITYDPSIVSYLELLEIFWRTHDPTTLNRQGPDIGTQYRSEIFYTTETQKKIAEKILDQKNKDFNGKIVTKVSKVLNYCKAEDYHQKYLKKRGM